MVWVLQTNPQFAPFSYFWGPKKEEFKLWIPPKREKHFFSLILLIFLLCIIISLRIEERSRFLLSLSKNRRPTYFFFVLHPLPKMSFGQNSDMVGIGTANVTVSKGYKVFLKGLICRMNHHTHIFILSFCCSLSKK